MLAEGLDAGDDVPPRRSTAPLTAYSTRTLQGDTCKATSSFLLMFALSHVHRTIDLAKAPLLQ